MVLSEIFKPQHSSKTVTNQAHRDPQIRIEIHGLTHLDFEFLKLNSVNSSLYHLSYYLDSRRNDRYEP